MIALLRGDRLGWGQPGVSGHELAQDFVGAEAVFAGYGVTAPEYRWDDFKGMDVRGKLLLVLVNDPPATAEEPTLFDGNAMTYYGRWTYKFEEAERRGAVGMLIIHTTERAGYPWHTVVGSWAKEQRMLPRDPSLPPPLAVRGWITDSAATALLAHAGLDVAPPTERITGDTPDPRVKRNHCPNFVQLRAMRPHVFI